MSNSIKVMGNLTRDDEFITTDSGRKFASFTVADSSFYKDDKTEEWVSARDTIFWNVTAGDGLDTSVKSVVSKLTKGSPVEIVGRVTKVDGFISKKKTVYVNINVSLTDLTLIPRSKPAEKSDDKAPF